MNQAQRSKSKTGKTTPAAATHKAKGGRAQERGGVPLVEAQKPAAADSALVRRLARMGLTSAAAVFPAGGVSLFRFVPWWRAWPRNVRRNTLEGFGVAVLPAVASGVVNLRPDAPVGQGVFAALLPLFDPVRAIEHWANWGAISLLDQSCSGPAAIAVVLEHLLRAQPASERARVWSRILACAFERERGVRNSSPDQVLALLEAIGRTGLRALAPQVLLALRHNNQEVMLAAVACLARLGVPDPELPTEVLLNQVRPKFAGQARWALGYVESGDPDLLTALLRHPDWGERIQALRLVEAFLARDPAAAHPGAAWDDGLIDLLLAHLQQEQDKDVVRCLAVPLGRALQRGDEAQLTKAMGIVAKLNDEERFESLLNALLLAELPVVWVSELEGFRKQAVGLGADAVRALNRLLMSLGSSSGTARDWLESSVIVLLQMGVLRLPESVRVWFDSPGDCPQQAVTAWLLERPVAGLPTTFAGAYLEAHPEFALVLERIWVEAADNRKTPVLRAVGCLLAAAAKDGAVSPAELRCCLGHEVGGALAETPEMVGQLLGLLMTQENEVHQSALELLLLTSAPSRAIVCGCLQALKRTRTLFGDDRIPLARFGPLPMATIQVAVLPEELHPLFAEDSPSTRDPERLLAGINLPDEKSKLWVRRCLDWKVTEAVRATFEPTDSVRIVSAFLQATASPDPVSRELAGLLAAGVGARLLETPHRNQLVQRVVWLAAHDPHAASRLAGRKAAEALGVTGLIPELPAAATPAPSDPNDQSPADDLSAPCDDVDLDALMRELGNELSSDF